MKEDGCWSCADPGEDGIGQIRREGQGKQSLVEAELGLPVTDDIGKGSTGDLGVAGRRRVLIVVLAALLRGFRGAFL